jgi:hypothetical protein
MRALIFSLLLVSGFAVHADDANILATWKKLESNRKGPFSVNVLQYNRGRQALGGNGNDGCIKVGGAGSMQFQAAYRNAIAQELAAKEDFYLANLYTTNYYMLMGEYVYNDACANHDLDHQALVNQSVNAMPKAMSMFRHAVLERFYLESFPSSRLATRYKLRGISDSQNEQDYARHFFNFMLSGMTQDIQFLPIYLLAKKSPVGVSPVLQKARDAIANLYTSLGGGDGGPGSAAVTDMWGQVVIVGDSAMLRRLYQLRNAIHNTLSRDTIADIEKFKRDFPGVGTQILNSIQANLRAYYATSAGKISELAKALKLEKVKAAADPLIKGPVTPAGLLALSQQVAEVRASINDPKVFSWEQKTEALLLVANAAQYLAKEVNSMKVINSVDAIKVLLNTIYLEGFLIKSNWQVFAGQMENVDLTTASGVLAKASVIAMKTTEKAFSPALEQWKVVEPKMENFLDNVIKSSSLSTAATVEAKLKK